MGRQSAIGLIGGLAVLAAAVAWLVPPIPQEPAYHRLADSRAWLGIPNVLNVLSNTGFLLVGALGLAFVAGGGGLAFREPGERWPYVVFFGGLLLTGFGSASYHWEPGNGRLAWDRLPLAITLMGLLAATIAERIAVKAGLWLLGPLVAIAAGSVIYWHWTSSIPSSRSRSCCGGSRPGTRARATCWRPRRPTRRPRCRSSWTGGFSRRPAWSAGTRSNICWPRWPGTGCCECSGTAGRPEDTTMESQTTTKALGRLRRIEGQVQGIQRMVEEDKSCVDILLQLAAVQGAVEQVQKLLLGQHLEASLAEAVRTPSSRDRQRKMDELLDVFSRFSGR
jgi:DNA-binding FrmR family transcriptional regulator